MSDLKNSRSWNNFPKLPSPIHCIGERISQRWKINMKEKIRENINKPEILEKLYRENKNAFASDFENIYSEIKKYELAKFWKVRLQYEKQGEDKIQFRGYDILTLIAVCIITGFLAKIPEVFNFDDEYFFFYHRNGGIILFFGLSSSSRSLVKSRSGTYSGINSLSAPWICQRNNSPSRLKC